MFTFDPSKVLKHHIIGSGAYSVVYPYGKTLEESQWVVKQLKAATFDKVLQILEEVVLGFNLSDNTLVPIRGYYINQPRPDTWEVYIKQPRMKKDLRKMIKNHHEQAQVDFAEEVVIKCFYAVASALGHLHSKRIAHRDIKPENILIDFDGNVKLGDIGGAKFVAEGESFLTVRDEVGTPSYSPPEIVKQAKHMKMKDLYKADVWSLGVVIVELCTGKRVYGIDKPEDIKRKLSKVEEKYSGKLVEVLEGVLQVDPEKRTSVVEIKKSLEDNFGDVIKSGALKASEIEDIEVKIKQESVLEITREYNPGRIVIEEAKNDKDEPKDNSEKLKFNFSKTKLSLDHCLASVKEQIKANIKFVNDFTLNFSNYSEMTSLGLKAFAMQIAPLNLLRLSVNFSECEKIKDDGISDFASIMAKPNLHNLEHLDISFARCTKIKDEGIKKLGDQIGLYLKRLNYLKINLHHCHRITNKGVKHLTYCIGKGLTQLQHLDIDLGKMTEVNEQGIKDLTSNLEPLLKKLQHFSLDLWGVGSIKNSGHLELISALGARAQNMQFLNISFGRCNDITDEVVLRIKKEIVPKLEGLKHLNINLDCSKITGDVAIELADAIHANLKKLTYLALSFDCTKIDKQIQSLIEKKLAAIQEVIITVTYHG